MNDEQPANRDGAKSQNSIPKLVFLRPLKLGVYRPSKPCLLVEIDPRKKINSLQMEIAIKGHL